LRNIALERVFSHPRERLKAQADVTAATAVRQFDEADSDNHKINIQLAAAPQVEFNVHFLPYYKLLCLFATSAQPHATERYVVQPERECLSARKPALARAAVGDWRVDAKGCPTLYEVKDFWKRSFESWAPIKLLAPRHSRGKLNAYSFWRRMEFAGRNFEHCSVLFDECSTFKCESALASIDVEKASDKFPIAVFQRQKIATIYQGTQLDTHFQRITDTIIVGKICTPRLHLRILLNGLPSVPAYIIKFQVNFS
jgi:hypothetical protein